MGHTKNYIFSFLATFLILIASISFWFYKDVYTKDTFKDHVSQALQTQDSREAIAALVIEESFKDRPVLRNVLSDQAEQLLAGALSGPRIQGIFDKLILKVYDSLFSPTPKAIAIELTPVKNIVSKLSQIIETTTGQERENIKIPDQIVLVKAGEIPSIAQLGKIILALGPITLIAGLALSLWLIWKSVDKVSAMTLWGGSLAIWSLITMLFSQWYKPLILATIMNANARTVAEQILNEFLKSFTNQSLLLFLFGLLLAAGGLVYQKFYPRTHKKAGS